MIDQTIAHYKVTAKIGEGGMGEVYRATDTKLDREVAIKILPPAFASDFGRMSRFGREAKVLASLNHPNIAAIYGVEERALVMELVEGDTLHGPLALDVALRYAKQIAEALEYAHERGVVHRDLKPANIKVTPDGTVKLLDFGLAKAIEDPATRDDDPTNSPTLTLGATRVGVILGTAAYMSPEQAAGNAADRRADIWSFGAVLYEMLSGKPAFGGESVSATLASVLKIDPDWSALPAAIPATILALVQRCLRRDRKQRLQAIGDARILLEEQLANPETVIEITQRARVRRATLAWGLAIVGIAAALIVSWVHFRETPQRDQVLRYTISVPESGEVNQYAVSPDGRYIVTSVTTNGKRQLWLRGLDAFQWQPMPFTEDAVDPFWKPDSRYIGFFAQGKLKKIPVSGGPAQQLCNVVDPRGGSWNQDDVIVFTALGVGLQRVSASGGVPTGLAKAEGGVTLFPVFLPGGRDFLVFKGGTNERSGLYLRSLDGTKNQLLLPRIPGAVFLPSTGNHSGHLLFVRENNVMAQPFDTSTAKLSGDAFPIAEGVDPAFGSRVSVSDNGIILYRLSKPDVSNQIVWIDRSGKLIGPVGASGNIGEPALSPDEKTIAFRRLTGGGQGMIWLYDVARRTELRFTSEDSRTPIWSPSGDFIAYFHNQGISQKASSGTGDGELLVRAQKDTAGNVIQQLLLNQWSRDGRFIIYQDFDSKNRRLWILPMDQDTANRKPFQFPHTEWNELHGQLSQDSRWFAYTSDESGQREVYVRPFPMADNKWKVSRLGGVQPRWRVDGKELFYIAGDGKMTVVSVKSGPGGKQSIEFGDSMPLFDASARQGQNISSFEYDVTADGKRFLVATATGSGAPQLAVITNGNTVLKQ